MSKNNEIKIMDKKQYASNEALSSKFDFIVSQYVNAFVKKHFREDDDEVMPQIVMYWVGNRKDEVIFINDYYIDFRDIRTDIDRDAPLGAFFEWYEYNTEMTLLGADTMNYESWLGGCPRISEEELNTKREDYNRKEKAIRYNKESQEMGREIARIVRENFPNNYVVPHLPDGVRELYINEWLSRTPSQEQLDERRAMFINMQERIFREHEEQKVCYDKWISNIDEWVKSVKAKLL